MPNLIGTAPNQVPVNGLLGTMAFQDSNAVTISSGTIGGVSVATIADTVLRGEQLDTIASSSSLVLRGGATNLLTYSEQFDNAAWVKTNASISANTIISPDGTLTGDKFVESTGLTSKYLSTVVFPANTYTLSVYAKYSNRQFLWLSVDGSVTAVFFDILSGTIAATGAGNTATITAIGNGWYKCSVTKTTASSLATFIGTSNVSNAYAYTGDGTSGVYIWGAQLEAASTAGAYLKTEATAVSTAYAAPIESPNGIAVPLIASMTPARNGDMTFQLTSNTSLTIKVKGSDGTVRSVALTLA